MPRSVKKVDFCSRTPEVRVLEDSHLNDDDMTLEPCHSAEIHSNLNYRYKKRASLVSG